VAELVLHHLQVRPGREGEGGCAVPQPVQRDRRQPGRGDQPAARRRPTPLSPGGAAKPRSRPAWLPPGSPTRCCAPTHTCRSSCRSLAPAIARTSGFGSSAGKGRAVMVDARDVGAVSAEIAPSPPPTPGRPTGSPARSWSPTTTSRRSCRSCLARVSDDVPAILGRPTRSFGQFAADYATAFSWVATLGRGGRAAGAPGTRAAETKTPVCGCRRASPPLPRPRRAPRRSCAVAAARAGCA